MIKNLKEYIILINGLVEKVDRIPEVLHLSSRRTIRDMLNQAYKVKLGRLVAEHGQPAVGNAEESIEVLPDGGYGKVHDRVSPPLLTPAPPSLPSKAPETRNDMASPTAVETGKTEVANKGHEQEEIIMQQISNASTMHLVRAGWRLPVRSKAFVALSKRLITLGRGTEIYVKSMSRG